MGEPTRYARVVGEELPRFVRIEGELGLVLDRAPWLGGTPTDETIDLSGATYGCPVSPSKIFGIGRNYRAHAEELGHDVPADPLVFTKPPSALLGPGGTVVLPAESDRVDYEGELGVVIGRRVRRIAARDAMEAVFGLTIVCDVTARDLQKRDGQWTRAKGFDTFCPVGPTLVSGLDPAALEVELRVNGEPRQHGSTASMIVDVPHLVEHLSHFATLEPGDLIATGTPAGVGALTAGDRVAISIDPIGTLAFDVAAEGRA